MRFPASKKSLSWLFHGCPFDSSIDSISIFALGISISLFAGAFFFPLFYLGGEERGDVFLIISLLCAVGIVLGITSVINFYLDPGLTTILLGATALIVCALLAFILSYPLTLLTEAFIYFFPNYKHNKQVNNTYNNSAYSHFKKINMPYVTQSC